MKTRELWPQVNWVTVGLCDRCCRIDLVLKEAFILTNPAIIYLFYAEAEEGKHVE